MVGKPETTLAEGGRPGWSIFGYHYPLLLVNFQLSQSQCYSESIITMYYREEILMANRQQPTRPDEPTRQFVQTYIDFVTGNERFINTHDTSAESA